MKSKTLSHDQLGVVILPISVGKSKITSINAPLFENTVDANCGAGGGSVDEPTLTTTLDVMYCQELLPLSTSDMFTDPENVLAAEITNDADNALEREY